MGARLAVVTVNFLPPARAEARKGSLLCIIDVMIRRICCRF